jgi:hypothetical protein
MVLVFPFYCFAGYVDHLYLSHVHLRQLDIDLDTVSYILLLSSIVLPTPSNLTGSDEFGMSVEAPYAFLELFGRSREAQNIAPPAVSRPVAAYSMHRRAG